MAVNESRSLTADMAEGQTDGKYRKARPNTTVSPASAETAANRRTLHADYGYGYATSETSAKVLPGGQR
jgi:hypothetical protein